MKEKLIEAEKVKEIIVEEKLYITEIEETIEADIPLPVEELTDVPKADGNCPPLKSHICSTFLQNSHPLSFTL